MQVRVLPVESSGPHRPTARTSVLQTECAGSIPAGVIAAAPPINPPRIAPYQPRGPSRLRRGPSATRLALLFAVCARAAPIRPFAPAPRPSPQPRSLSAGPCYPSRQPSKPSRQPMVTLLPALAALRPPLARAHARATQSPGGPLLRLYPAPRQNRAAARPRTAKISRMTRPEAPAHRSALRMTGGELRAMVRAC